MCGICGVVGGCDEALVRAMADLMAHRGPDGEGVLAVPPTDGGPPATLGHRRLSILDPTPRGAQPMTRDGGRYTITYNGEIYNFRSLRHNLEAEGERFESDCDTEVLLALYARHRAAALERLNGIFAFAVWDNERRELFLARDRLGVKPLYYALDRGRLIFASELKSVLLALDRVSLNETAVADYLTFLWVPDPETLIKGVLQLPPGHFAVYRDGRLTVQRWWDMEFAPEDGPVERWAPALRTGVQTAVRRQMVSDVPLGSFLSGGLDSSAIVAEMNAAVGPIKTYTVGFAPEDLKHDIVTDDVRYARLVGKAFGADYHEEILRPDIVDLLPRLVWHLDEPIGDPACISAYLICRAAREQLTVILSGMGGDEVFAGYPRHLAARYGMAIDLVPRPARRVLQRVIQEHVTLGKPGRLRYPRRSLMKFARGLAAGPDERYLIYSSYYTPSELQAVLGSELRSATAGHDPFRFHRECFATVRDQHWLNRLLYVDLKTFLPFLNLAYTDRMSMAASTEVRVPLLDDELVQLSGAIPPELKLRRLTRKYVLKRSMEGTLPKDVIWRPKAGFGAPVRSWVVGALRPLIDDLLSPQRVADRGLFNPAEVQRLIRANNSGHEDNALRLWALLTFELWQQAILDRAPSRIPA